MRLLILAALALALAAPAYAQTEAPAKPAAACHNRSAKAAKCAPARPAKKKAASQDGLKAQSFTQCRDVRTHTTTKCGGPYAEPMPAN